MGTFLSVRMDHLLRDDTEKTRARRATKFWHSLLQCAKPRQVRLVILICPIPTQDSISQNKTDASGDRLDRQQRGRTAAFSRTPT